MWKPVVICGCVLFSLLAHADETPFASIDLDKDSSTTTGVDLCTLSLHGAPLAKQAVVQLVKKAMEFCVAVDPMRDIMSSFERNDTADDTMDGVLSYNRKTKTVRFLTYDQTWAGAKKITGHD